MVGAADAPSEEYTDVRARVEELLDLIERLGSLPARCEELREKAQRIADDPAAVGRVGAARVAAALFDDDFTDALRELLVHLSRVGTYLRPVQEADAAPTAVRDRKEQKRTDVRTTQPLAAPACTDGPKGSR